MNPTPAHRVRIWDLPTRLFHWALTLAVTGAIASGLLGGAAMVWHERFGQAVLALLLFRLLWGLVGGRWSRFSALWLHPRHLLAALRGQDRTAWRAGHGPLGTLSVLAMLAVLGAQVGTGLLSDDAISYTGPLAHLVSQASNAQATGWHKGWGKLLILALVGLHVLAIALYSLRGRGLVGSMLHGDKALEEPVPGSRDDLRSRVLALVLALACAAASAWVFSLAPAGF